jgi:hypothetical protein
VIFLTNIPLTYVDGSHFALLNFGTSVTKCPRPFVRADVDVKDAFNMLRHCTRKKKNNNVKEAITYQNKNQ